MADPKPAFHLSLQQARAAAIAAQGLAGSPDGDLVDTLERTGFVRALGGIDVYLAARARWPAMGRADLDSAVARGDLKVVPAVRGCIYLVSRRHVPVVLRLADLLSRRRAARDHDKAGIREGEIETVGEAVIEVLTARGPLTTAALRAALPDDAVRSLGAAGKKVGISSPLPPALRRLEFDGRLERALEGGRLDTERYLWQVPADDPLAATGVDDDPAALHAQVAAIFFRAAGIATRKTFAAWAGLGQRDAKAAMASLALQPLAVEGQTERYWAGADFDPESLPDVSSAVALLPFEDNLTAYQAGPAFFVDAAYHGIAVPVWGRTKGTTLGDARHAALRSVVAAGRMVGFWEYDPDANEVVTACYEPPPASAAEALTARARELGSFIREEIGHGQSFSLDTDDSLRRRVAHLRGL